MFNWLKTHLGEIQQAKGQNVGGVLYLFYIYLHQLVHHTAYNNS